MSRADEAYFARRLADAVKDLERLELFQCSAQFDDSLRVTWGSGSALGGYEEMSRAVSVIVSEGWNALRDEAISRAAKKVDAARAELLAALESPK